mmetsp:Transcript_64594/g.148534  ORF Transcript_64594/g.148534 Transcript_64594/m.148534 type:complete len:150 (+) Transcript_64594:151-600(+)
MLFPFFVWEKEEAHNTILILYIHKDDNMTTTITMMVNRKKISCEGFHSILPDHPNQSIQLWFLSVEVSPPTLCPLPASLWRSYSASSVGNSYRHTGQVFRPRSQASRQPSWKACAQGSRSTAAAPAANSSLQMMHSFSSSISKLQEMSA